MLDTLHINFCPPLRTDLDDCRCATLPGCPIKVQCLLGELRWLECSLPRVLFGSNRRLITSQAEINEGIGRIIEDLEFSTPGIKNMEAWRITRLDPCWNFDLPAPLYIRAHALLRLPGVRPLPTVWDGGNGLTWRSAHSRLKLDFYNKSLKSHGLGQVLRVELSLRGHELTRRLGKEDWRDIMVLYRIYRGVLLTLSPIEKPKSTSLAQAIGIEPPETVDRILARLDVPERTLRRYRHDAMTAPLPASFSWAKVLPENQLPSIVNVEEKLHTSRRKSKAQKTLKNFIASIKAGEVTEI
jgi:hypothetical protein